MLPTPIFTFVILGFPNAEVLASSRSAIVFTPNDPHSRTKAVSSSPERVSSKVAKRAFSIKVNISSLVLLRFIACSAYAAIPFSP